MLKQTLKKVLRQAGLEVRRTRESFWLPVEFTKRDREVYHYVLDRQLTMVSPERLVATIKACKHAVEAEIEGDFVECGVWRGGVSLAAKLTFENYGSDKRVWLFDTFTGMTEPTEADRAVHSGKSARDTYFERQNDGGWCLASLRDVRSNFEKAGANLEPVHFVEGDVLTTLADEANLPQAISVLRLDTDWYESTKKELEILYPRLSAGGSLLIDDFGHWEGARKAVEQYFALIEPAARPLLHYTDHCGRMGVKIRQVA